MDFPVKNDVKSIDMATVLSMPGLKTLQRSGIFA